jgi:hypothetical protein
MKRVLPVFERFRIKKPCPIRWEDMVGDARTRFCAVCNKHVHDLGGMTPDEARALVASGRACVQVKMSAAIPSVAAAAAAGIVFALSAACTGSVAEDATPTVADPPAAAPEPAADTDGGHTIMLGGEIEAVPGAPTPY